MDSDKHIEELLQRYWLCEGEDFDARVLAAAGVPVVKAKRVTLTSRFLPLFKAVAVVAVVVGLGGVVQRSFFADVEEVTIGDTIGRQISTPSVALSGEVPDVAAEKQKLDSLKGVFIRTIEAVKFQFSQNLMKKLT